MFVVVARFHRRIEPADELAPAQPPSCVLALTVAEPRRGEHGGAVVVEDVDLVVVEGDDDLELRIVVEVADADVLAVGAVAAVAGAVEVGVVARAAQPVVPRPRRGRRALRPVERAPRAEDEHLRAGRRGVRRRHDDLGPAVSVEIGRRESSRLGALAAAARRGGPARLRAGGDRREARTQPPCPRCRRRRSPSARRRRDPRRRRVRRPALSSQCPCRAGAPSRRRRTSSRRAQRARAGGRRSGRRAPGEENQPVSPVLMLRTKRGAETGAGAAGERTPVLPAVAAPPPLNGATARIRNATTAATRGIGAP